MIFPPSLSLSSRNYTVFWLRNVGQQIDQGANPDVCYLRMKFTQKPFRNRIKRILNWTSPELEIWVDFFWDNRAISYSRELMVLASLEVTKTFWLIGSSHQKLFKMNLDDLKRGECVLFLLNFQNFKTAVFSTRDIFAQKRHVLLKSIDTSMYRSHFYVIKTLNL